MFDTKTVTTQWGGKTLTLETGRVARQADGAVMATLGETVVLCAVTAAKSVKEGQDFFPLTVHYQEKYSAAGRIPGGFFKRERGATEKETLTSRLIDRPIRPLFPEGFYNEINVIAQVLSYDGESEPDIVAMIAAMTLRLSSCANITAPSISSSVSSLASDSTIITASWVAATTRSRRPSATCAIDGLRMYSPSWKPTRVAPIGPMKGTPEIVSAAEAAISATISASVSPS